jgi:branched-chain amino acid transport system permease protein
MTSAQIFYVINLLIYAGVDMVACLGLSQQFGVAGVTNFGFIIFQAAGAYTASLLSLPPSSANGGFQSYIGGWDLPFPLPWIGAAIVGGLVALPFTFVLGRRLRGDYAAVGLLVTAVMANLLVTNYRPFLNGAAGLSLVPSPLQGEFNPQAQGYGWAYSAMALLFAVGAYLLLRRITESPYGRSMRAMRDNDLVADSLGKNLVAMRAAVLVTGGALAGLSGGILVGFINLWAPSAWGYAETIVLFAAVIIGGAGNHRGAMLGAVLVPVAFEEATRFLPQALPQSIPPAVIDDMQWVVIGLLIVGFLWLRPRGILPERKRTIFIPNGRVPSQYAPASADELLPAGAAPLAEMASVIEMAPAMATGASPTPDVMLRTVGLTRDFGGVHAVADVSLAVRHGTLTGLIGPNGAGKSTLLSMLAGTLPATDGQVFFDGTDVTRTPAYKRARLGLVRTFQLASEFKRLTVMENLLSAVPGQRGDSFRGALAGPRYWRRDEDAAIDRAATILDRFGLRDYANTYAGDLSGGQRRIVEIMRALMTAPRVLLLDEPMAGVHPVLARRIGDALLELCAEGMTIVMVEHELAIMDEYCDPVIVMAEGMVLAEGTMRALRERAEVVEAYLVG